MSQRHSEFSGPAKTFAVAVLFVLLALATNGISVAIYIAWLASCFVWQRVRTAG